MNKTSTIETVMSAGQGAVISQPRERTESVPSPRPSRSLRRMRSMQKVDTSMQGAFTVTPASAHSASSITNSPSWSFQGSPYYSHAFQQSSLSTVDLLTLPDPLISSSLPTSLSSSFPRQNGLTRKLSSGKRALSRLGRTASSGANGRRDPSSGPVARRRSDSKTSAAAAFDTEEPIPDMPIGLGLYHGTGSLEDAGSISDLATRNEQRAEIVAPAVPQALLAGCVLTKINKRKVQDKVFYLDSDGSTVSWMGTVKWKDFCLDNIKSIRSGKDAASSWNDISGTEVDEDRCFTVNYAPSASSKGTKTLHLLAPTKHWCQLWVRTLEALAKHREELMSEMTGTERQSVLRAHWESELSKQSRPKGPNEIEGLDLNAVARLCRKLHIHCPRNIVEEGFHTLDTRDLGLLDFHQFRAFVARLRARVDIKPLFNQLKAPGVEGVRKDEFLRFLGQEQGINVYAHYSYWVDRFDALATRSSDATNGNQESYMDFAAFTSFMTSKDCHVYAAGEKERVSFSQPLNEYFISSSHNTYLIGRQVNGTSSVEAYVTALRRGCRSVEIDCWNGDNNNPRVTHGFTGTSSVPFVEVIRAINRSAFEASPYPVILSLEVHCNPAQQLRMVDIMKDNIDAGKLLLFPLPDHTSDLPSPDDLKYKILIKVKATNAHPILQTFADTVPTTRKRSTSSPVRRAVPYQANSTQHVVNMNSSSAMTTPPESIVSPTDQSMTPSSEDDYESDANGIAQSTTAPSRARKTSKIIKDLADLGVYLQGYSYRSAADLSFQQFNHIFSINENAAITVSKQQESKIPFEKHNTSFMCRVYPKGTRFNSSNFDPNTFWRRGVQMVALNWQTYDIHMQMNQAMFGAGNDRTGYVLKPSYLRDPHRFDGTSEQRPKLHHQRINFTVKVISAQQLPLFSSMGKNELISPFVEVQMFSAEDKARGIAYGQGGEEVSRTNSYHGIGSPYSRRTKTVPENGFNPQFNNVIELSLETKYPELVFVRFVVYQSNKGSHKELAVFTAKLDRLQRGYRHLPLYNNNGEELIFSTLFCHISKQQPSESVREIVPTRHSSIRKFLPRSNTVERGRTRGQTFADSERLAAQKKLNQEIEAKRR